MTTKTLEQLQAEAQAAAEALALAQRNAAMAELEAKQEARRKADLEREAAINQQRAAAIAPVIAALQAAKITVNDNDNATGFEVPTAEGGWHKLRGYAKMEQQTRSRGSYMYRNTGRVLIDLQGTTNDDRRRFPPIKAGGHNVAKIVATVQEWLQQSQARVDAAKVKAAKTKTAQQLAQQVRIDNGYAPDDESCPIKWQREHSYPKGGGRYEYHTYQPTAGKVYVQVGTLELTPDQTKIMLDALKAIEALRKAERNQQ